MAAIKGKLKRNNNQMAHDKAVMAELSLKGYTLQRIVDEINGRYKASGVAISITTTSVCKELKQIREEWRKSGLLNTNEHKMIQLKKLDILEQQYWDSWQRSIEKPVKKTVSKKISYRSGEEMKQSEAKEEDFYGDPRFLDGINKCIQQRSALLGLANEDGTVTNNNLIITIEESTVGVVVNQ